MMYTVAQLGRRDSEARPHEFDISKEVADRIQLARELLGLAVASVLRRAWTPGELKDKDADEAHDAILSATVDSLARHRDRSHRRSDRLPVGVARAVQVRVFWSLYERGHRRLPLPEGESAGAYGLAYRVAATVAPPAEVFVEAELDTWPIAVGADPVEVVRRAVEQLQSGAALPAVIHSAETRRRLQTEARRLTPELARQLERPRRVVEEAAQEAADRFNYRPMRERIEDERAFIGICVRNALNDLYGGPTTVVLDDEHDRPSDDQQNSESDLASALADDPADTDTYYEWISANRERIAKRIEETCTRSQRSIALGGLALFIDRQASASTARTRLFKPYCLDALMIELGIDLNDEHERNLLSRGEGKGRSVYRAALKLERAVAEVEEAEPPRGNVESRDD